MSPTLRRNKTVDELKARSGDMSLLSHLGELRKRVFISIAAVFVGAIVGFLLWNWVLDVATAPYCNALRERNSATATCDLYITEPLQLITTRLSVAVYIGIFIAAPVILWQLWRFITPGLNPKEKRYAVPFVSSSVVLFLLGLAVAWLTFPKAMAFFLAVGGDHVQTLFNPAPYLKLIFVMMLIFGVVFEMPLLIIFLELAGIVSSQQLRSVRRYAIVANFGIAAVVTPSQDPYSLAAMAIPMCLFYEIAIVAGRLMKK